MAFASRAANHEHAHGQETRKVPSHRLDRRAELARHAFDEILPDEKKRLNGANVSRAIFEKQIPMLEVAIERLLENLVIPMILAPGLKSALPGIAIMQVGARHNFCDAVRKRNRATGGRNHVVRCLGSRSWAATFSTFRTPLRMCRSRCGRGISIPALRRCLSIRKFRSLLNRRGR